MQPSFSKKLIHYSSCSQPFNERLLLQRSSCNHSFFQAYRAFSERKFLARGYQSPTMIPPSSHACLNLKIICYLTMSISPVHFFYCTVFVSREHVKRSIVSRIFYLSQNTYYSHQNKRSMVDSRKF